MESIHSFLQNIIDYAGLFPPAKLDMDSAIENYRNYFQCEHAWMLSRFICPIVRVSEVKDPQKTWKFSVLGGNQENYSQTLIAEIAEINSFHEKSIVDVWESKFPENVIAKPDRAKDFCLNWTEIAEHNLKNPLQPFWEISFIGDWQKNLAVVVETVANHNQNTTNKLCQSWGIKVRTGGVDASFFPTPEQLAYIIYLCRQNRVCFKATAGLHHPFRHYSESVHTKMYGFFNVFIAAALAAVVDADLSTIQQALEDEDPQNFRVENTSISWKDYHLNIENLQKAREFAISFGSCSFEEPLEDLQQLQMI